MANKIRISLFRKISPSISRKAWIGKNVEIYPCVAIEVGVIVGHNAHLNWCLTIKKGTKIGRDVYFNTQNHNRNQTTRLFEGLTETKPIIIGEYCWIGTRAIVLGVTIGDYSTIGSGSIVTKSIPQNCMAAGNPAVVKKIY